MDNSSTEKDQDLLKVIRIDVLTATPNIRTDNRDIIDFLPEIPLLSFELENGSSFMMSSIPKHIAFEIARVLSGIREVDSRLSVADLVSEICIVKKVVIDAIVPFSNAYQASVEIELEGVEGVLHFQMIPSHSVLIGLLTNAPIYVSRFLLSAPKEQND
ncbi:MAG: hypothetical protein ACTSQE_09780 [Candidatus Heimdallarchaeaceae archaeon]